DRGPRRAIAFAEQVFGRVPAAVLRQEFLDEGRERGGVDVDAVELLLLVLAGDAAEAGAGRVDEDEIAGVEERVGIVDHLVRRRRGVRIVAGHDTLGPKGAHVQPDGRRAGTAIEQEGYRATARRDAALGVIDEEHRRFRR